MAKPVRRPLGKRRTAAPGEDARERAARKLASRPRTEAELRALLASEDFRAEEVDRAVRWAREAGHLDDGALAERWIATRAHRGGYGRARLVAELLRRGVERDVAEAAWRRAVEEGEVVPEAVLERALERKVASLGGRLDDRAAARVYNALLRAGFDASDVRAALESRRLRKDRP